MWVRVLAMCTLCVACTHTVHAQYERVRMDSVVSFISGTGPEVGHGPAFFPANVFRGPDPNATDTTPALDAREICSLGLDGMIILGLREHAIVDGPGADFIVFENAFIGPRGKVFAEPAAISVSKDLLVWYAFPFDSASLVGCAGVTPTSGQDPFDAAVSGGDAYDLADIGVDSVRYIRVQDVTNIVKNNPSHIYYDPTLSGFDLDVITVPHAMRIATWTGVSLEPRTTNVIASVQEGTGMLRVFNVYGQLLYEQLVPEGICVVPLGFLVNTCLLVTLEANASITMTKVLQ